MRTLLVLLAAVTIAPVQAPDGALPEGARLTARLNQTIGTVKAMGPDRVADLTHAGQEWAATLVSPVVDGRGRTLVPAGALVHGRIATLARGEGLQSAKLELTAERLDNRPLGARVVDPEVQQLPSADPGKTVDSAAFGGILLGAIAFGIPGIVIGYGFGGAGGGVAAMRERTTEGWLYAGTLLTIELEAPLTLGCARPSC